MCSLTVMCVNIFLNDATPAFLAGCVCTRISIAHACMHELPLVSRASPSYSNKVVGGAGMRDYNIPLKLIKHLSVKF